MRQIKDTVKSTKHSKDFLQRQLKDWIEAMKTTTSHIYYDKCERMIKLLTFEIKEYGNNKR